jgi:cell division protease FtsH
MKQVTRTQFVSRPRDEDRTTRAPLPLWDRVKFFILFGALFGLFVWSETGDNPILPVSEAVRNVVHARWWLFILVGLELLRQVHFLVAEHWSRYYLFWKRRFVRFDKRRERINPWTRFRLGRVAKVLLWFAVFNAFVAWRNDTPFFKEISQLPTDVFDFLFGTANDLPLIGLVAFEGLISIGALVGIFWFLSRGGVDVYFPDDIKTRFSDVWGQDAVLDRVKENILFLEHPDVIEDRGGYVPGGILLYGPPGTGKTLMAEAVAGETGHPFVFVEPSALIGIFIGVGPLKVRSIFKKLRKLALRYGGVVVFFDEADSLGNRGGGGAGVPGLAGAHRLATEHSCHGDAYLSPSTTATLFRMRLAEQAEEPPRGLISRLFPMPMGGGGGGGDMSLGGLQALLSEISGLKKPRGFWNRTVRRALGMRPKPPPKYRILVMMATNRPDSLDPAFLRPGRIDRIYRVGYPTKGGRIVTYNGYLAKVQHELTDEHVEKLAMMTPYATGATIKDLVNEALVIALRDGRETVTWQDVLEARLVKRLGPSRDVELVAHDRHSVAVHEACHAMVAYRARKHLEIDIATIDPGTDYLGLVGSIRIEDRFTQFKSESEADVMVSLASLAGERIFFDGDSASGVAGDLESATTMTLLMEGFWGMGQTIASHAVTDVPGLGGGVPGGGGKGREQLLRGSLGERVEENLERLLRRTQLMIEKDRETVLCVAHALETNKTLAGEDVVAVIERQPGVALDGTRYAEPWFVRQIVEYHAAMLEAHRQQQVGVDIPVPLVPQDATPPFAAVSAIDAPHPNGDSHVPDHDPDPGPPTTSTGEPPYAP